MILLYLILFHSRTAGYQKKKGSDLSCWPSVYFMDINNYFNTSNLSNNLMDRLKSEYKEQKAYSYFKCDWVKGIYYHPITVVSKYQCLKGRETPSCTCTAGLLGCCNHVIAMPFRIEAAVRTGATKPFSTSDLAKWSRAK